MGHLGNHNARKHGLHGSREWYQWMRAKSRCFNPNNPKYRIYGGRGISMCDKWRHSIVSFYEDMGPCPPGYSLERRDTNGGYSPDNCMWATIEQQNNNRRGCLRVCHDGNNITVKAYAASKGVTMMAVYGWIRRGKLDATTLYDGQAS